MCFLFLSCESTIESDIGTAGEKKLVIESYLQTGDSVLVKVSSSAKITEEILSFTPNLDVYITHNENKHKLNYAVDRYGASHYYLPSSQFTVPNTGDMYLETYFNGKHVTSKATVPEKIKIKSYDVNLDVSQYFDDIFWEYRSGISVSSIRLSADFKNNSFVLVELKARKKYILQGTVTYYEWATVFREYLKIKENRETIIINNTTKSEKRVLVDTTNVKSYKLFLYAIENVHYEFYRATSSQKNDGDLLGSIFGNNVTEIQTNINNGYGIFTVMNVDTLRKELP